MKMNDEGVDQNSYSHEAEMEMNDQGVDPNSLSYEVATEMNHQGVDQKSYSYETEMEMNHQCVDQNSYSYEAETQMNREAVNQKSYSYPNPMNDTYKSPTVPPSAYPPQPNVSPYPPPSPVLPRVRWSSGLFDCEQDNSNCAATAVSPCITFGQIAEIVDGGQTTCTTAGFMFSILIACPWIYTNSYRTRLRNRYNLEEAPVTDILAHFLFLPCALCQEYRELKIRGLHPGIGWAGNQGRPVSPLGMAAPPGQAMRR